MGVTMKGRHPDFDRLASVFQAGRREAAMMAGQILVRGAHKEVLNGAKSGVHYANLPNRSSAPGESPANQSGQYLKGFDYKVDGSGETLEFGNRSPHAVYLEDGTSKMAPRPGLLNTINATSGVVRGVLENVVLRKIKGAQ